MRIADRMWDRVARRTPGIVLTLDDGEKIEVRHLGNRVQLRSRRYPLRVTSEFRLADVEVMRE